jgi:hypothetical protein
MGNREVVSGWQAAAFVAVSLAALLVTAKIAAIRRAMARGNRPALPQVEIPPNAGYADKAA